MADPYRAGARPCPACGLTLREHLHRLVCDECEGIMLEVSDLANAVTEITGAAEPRIDLEPRASSDRRCPRCDGALQRARLQIAFDDQRVKPRPEVDRCVDHGLWFDGGDLAAVFEKVNAKSSPRGVRSDRAFVPDWQANWGSRTRRRG